MSSAFDTLLGKPTKTASSKGGSAFDALLKPTADTKASVSNVPNTTPITPRAATTQLWNGQQIPASVSTKNLVSYDQQTGEKTFKMPSFLGGGVYKEDANGKIVKGSHTTYGGVPPTPGFERADIVPVSLGGVNSDKNNIALEPLLPKDQQKPGQLTVSDQNLAKLNEQVRQGKMSSHEALARQISFQESNNFPDTKKPGFWSKVGDVVGDVGRGLKTGGKMIIGQTDSTDTTKHPVRQLIEMYTKPSDMVQQAEKGVPNVPILKQAGQAILRTIIPMGEGFGTIIGSDIWHQSELANEVANNKTINVVGKQAQSNVSEDLVTHKLTAEDVLNVALNSIQIGLLVDPLLKGPVTDGAIKLADTFAKESKVPISYSDLQKITSSTSDAEAISRVGSEKFNAYREAANSNSVRQALKDGYVKLAAKEPTTFSNILKNAATRPITEVASFGKTYGADVNIPATEGKLLPEKAGQAGPVSSFDSLIEKGQAPQASTELPALTTAKEVAAKVEAKVGANKILDTAKTQSANLLPSPNLNTPIAGDNFVLNNKVNKANVEVMKSINAYKDAVKTFNEKPTAPKLVKLQKAKAAMDALRQNTPAASAPPSLVKPSSRVQTKVVTPSVPPKIAAQEAVLPKAAEPQNPIEVPTSNPAPAKIEGKTPSKIAQSIEAKSVEQQLTKGFDGVAGYDKITIKNQAEKATQLMSEPEKAMRVIKGQDPLPEGLRGTALITAAEEYIKKTGDAKMAYELANSPLVSETSAAAQELRLAAEREPDSATAKLQEIKKAREVKAARQISTATKTVAKAIKAEVEKVNLSKEDLNWEKFLQEIKC